MSQSGGIQFIDQRYGTDTVEINASSGVQANAAATVTLPANPLFRTFITGFEVTALGATAAANLDVTVTMGATVLHYQFTIPAGATLPATALIVEFTRPVPAPAINTAIVVSCPAAGAGNTYVAVNAHGFQA